MKKVLNVGGNNKSIAIPPQYDGFEHLLLDIDPTGEPDIVCDARLLTDLDVGQFDAIYCSHNLEHYYRHDVDKVLKGFLHVLKEGGWADIRVPDIGEVMEIVVERGLDLEDVLYESPAGPISVLDVLYGFGKQIETSGVDFYAHKTGFTKSMLERVLLNNGFSQVFMWEGDLEIGALGFKGNPSQENLALWGIK